MKKYLARELYDHDRDDMFDTLDKAKERAKRKAVGSINDIGVFTLTDVAKPDTISIVVESVA